MKQFTGVVVSTIDKTSAVVLVESSWKHPLYKKTVKRSKKYLVQNDKDAKVGQAVTIQETRPLSARKRFYITEVFKK
ncbi:MAG: 30S ribosomal protein S17 [bacterium]|nr:30S ribosomal protein S17 [Candidatus Microgenomates bacterium CPR3]MCQ3944660.1 30S ribosomal protein S17 [bacterium]RIK51122.1 MAG: 30S ribosomal protein S17 [Candidatus Microgenomates bacterium]